MFKKLRQFLLKLLGAEPQLNVGQTTPVKELIPCRNGKVRHNPILLKQQGGKKLDYAESEDGAVIRFTGIVGCPKCKQYFLIEWDTVLPKFWDSEKMEIIERLPEEEEA